jgi:hypothetical protein
VAGAQTYPGSIFVLVICEPLKIPHQARRINKLFGKHSRSIYRGPLKGGKLHEPLSICGEELVTYDYDLIWTSKYRNPKAKSSATNSNQLGSSIICVLTQSSLPFHYLVPFRFEDCPEGTLLTADIWSRIGYATGYKGQFVLRARWLDGGRQELRYPLLYTVPAKILARCQRGNPRRPPSQSDRWKYGRSRG